MRFCKYLALGAVCALVAVPVPGQGTTENKAAPCTLTTLTGNYGGHAEGMVYAGAPNAPAQAAAVGIHSFDGAGNYVLTYAGGTGVVPAVWGLRRTGTYMVTPDCHFSVEMSDAKATYHITGVIIGEGVNQEGHFIYTDPFIGMAGAMKKIVPDSCSQESLKGTYTVYGEGLASLPGAPAFLPTIHVGFFTSDGRGNFVGEHTMNVAGQTATGQYTAEYLLDSQCVQHVKLSTEFGEIDEVGVFTGSGRAQEFHGIISNAGWVVAETVKRR